MPCCDYARHWMSVFQLGFRLFCPIQIKILVGLFGFQLEFQLIDQWHITCSRNSRDERWTQWNDTQDDLKVQIIGPDVIGKKFGPHAKGKVESTLFLEKSESNNLPSFTERKQQQPPKQTFAWCGHDAWWVTASGVPVRPTWPATRSA